MYVCMYVCMYACHTACMHVISCVYVCVHAGMIPDQSELAEEAAMAGTTVTNALTSVHYDFYERNYTNNPSGCVRRIPLKVLWMSDFYL